MPATRATEADSRGPPACSSPSHSAVFMVIRRISSFGLWLSPGTNSRIQLYENFICCSELPQESQVAALQQANIIDRVAHHGQTRQSQAERETAPVVRINTAHAQDVRMHQATGHQLHPAALFADGAAGATADQALDVELEARFRKGKYPGRRRTVTSR